MMSRRRAFYVCFRGWKGEDSDQGLVIGPRVPQADSYRHDSRRVVRTSANGSSKTTPAPMDKPEGR